MVENDDAAGCVTGLSAFALTWALGWPTGALRAAVAMKGWEWFVADTFDVPGLGFVPAWGLFFLVGFATMRPDLTPDDRSPYHLAAISLGSSVIFSVLAFVSLLILASLR